MKVITHNSWGRVFFPEQEVARFNSRHDRLPNIRDGVTMLPYGLGRSYGDSCLNDGGKLLLTRPLDRLMYFDADQGVIRCEGGVSLEEMLGIIVPKGWFLPVTPGTKYVTIGGAIANDVHGKNHHRSGNFGHHVRGFELLRSDGTRMYCSPDENTDWFYATIGGLGLTGLIVWAEVKLKKINNPYFETENIKFDDVDEFFDLAESSDQEFEHTVAWIDCMAQEDSLGRGIFMRGNHAGEEVELPQKGWSKKGLVPLDMPSCLLSKRTIKVFNSLYYHRQRKQSVSTVSHYDPFFYPLDSLHHWNRLYGKRGFFQYQCVVPYRESRDPICDILQEISDAGEGSFLGVLKVFGNLPSLGKLSFPREGVTLALDFANKGESTLKLFKRLDAITHEAKGVIYPAKDARMSAMHFKEFYPQWTEFQKYIDPQFSSSFWRRVTEEDKKEKEGIIL